MRIKHLSFALLLAALFMCVATTQTATAQTVEARGKVTLRAADGTETPVDKAVVTIYRTDIKGKYDVKTNKKGEYVRVGLPFGGTYIVVVSAPGARPSYQSGVRFGQVPELNFALDAGDGRVITLEEAQAASVAATAPAGGGGNAAPPADSAEVRKAREEEAKRVAAYEAEKVKVTATNDQMKAFFKTGNDALNAKRYDEAVTAYDQAIAAVGNFPPALSVFHSNKAAALKNRGLDKYNAAVKESDAAAKESGRNAARADLKLAIEAANLSVENAKKAMSAPGDPAAGGGANKQSDMLSALTRRVDVYRTALLIKVPDLGDKASAAFQEYIAAETDKAKKDKAQADYPKVLFDSGNVKESVVAYRQVLATNPNNVEAMYGLAQALSGSATDANSMKEARDAFQSFMTKANGAEYADRKKEAEATIAAFDEALKDDAAPKAQPATNRNRRRNN